MNSQRTLCARGARLAVLGFVSLFAASLTAQAGKTTLATRTLLGGITVELPSDWRPIPEEYAKSSERSLRNALASVTDSALRASLAAGQPVFLLRESVEGAIDPGANVNAAPSPGSVPGLFDTATDPQIRQALAGFCASFADLLMKNGGRVISCGEVQTERVNGHVMTVRRVVRTGPAGFVSLWIAQYPDKDVFYTLTLTAPQAREAEFASIYAAAWRSMRIPAQ